MGWDSQGKKKKRHARDNAFCIAGVQPRSQMSQEPLQRTHAQTPSAAAALRMAGGSGCARTCALASSRDILGQCNKQFMSAHRKDYWCFHWGNIYTPSSFLFLAPWASSQVGGWLEEWEKTHWGTPLIPQLDGAKPSYLGLAADATFSSFPSSFGGYDISLQYRWQNGMSPAVFGSNRKQKRFLRKIFLHRWGLQKNPKVMNVSAE